MTVKKTYSIILVALDGSDLSLLGGRIGLDLAKVAGARVVACHVYGAELHRTRFMDMEPGLKAEYQDQAFLRGLRKTHDSLINDGLAALSRGYMDRFLLEADEAKVKTVRVELEGRNYTKILELARTEQADLIVLGAHGLGDLGDGRLGSTVNRVLRSARADLLVARTRPRGKGILAGIDGSQAALNGLERAGTWSGLAGSKLELAAAFDPLFHNQVFKAMARSLSPQRQEEVGLAAQEKLHQEIIDEGLASLYRVFLGRAAQKAGELGLTAAQTLLQGKPYRALVDHLDKESFDLVLVGRHGHHREPGGSIGSNAEAVAALAPTNVLVTAAEGSAGDRALAQELEWEEEALARLAKIPPQPRVMARRAVEELVRAKGGDKVTLADLLEAARRFGMSGEDPAGGRG